MNQYRIQINSGMGPAEVRTFVLRLTQTITKLLKRSGLTVISTDSAGDKQSPHFVVIEVRG